MHNTFDPDNEKLIEEVVHVSDGTGGMLVGRRHSDNGIKAFNSSTGQGLEMEGGEVVITRNAVSDPKKRSFNGQMLTNRQILSKINESGGGVSFAEGGEIPPKINILNKQIEIDGEKTTDIIFAQSVGYNSTLKEGGQIFTVNGTSFNINKIYYWIHNGVIDHEIIEIDTFPVNNRILNKDYRLEQSNNLTLPQGIMVGDTLIDGNHRMNEAYKIGLNKLKVYRIAPNTTGWAKRN